LRPVRGLTGILNLAWTDAKLRDDTTPAPGILNLTGGLAGDLLPYTPRIQASLSADYEWTIAGNTRAYVGGNVRIVGDEPAAFNATYRATFKRRLTLDGYTTVDLRAGVDLGRVSISAFARNITNSHGLVNAGYPTTIPAVVGGTNVPFATASSIRPRTIGMTLGFAY
jgi:iron complex outermembrane receptor protein